MPGVPMSSLVQCAAARGLDLAFVTVLITGSITFNNLPPQLGVSKGDKVEVSFLTLPSPMDRIANDGSGVHMMDGIGAYPICNETFSLKVGGLSATMGDPLPPEDPTLPVTTDTFLSLVSKRPVNDGIFLSTSATGHKPLPLIMTGTRSLYKPEWFLDFAMDYKRGAVPSIHMEDAPKDFEAKPIKSEFTLSTGFATNIVLDVSIDSIKFKSSH